MQNNPWVLFLGAWKHADATMDLSVTVNDGVSAHARCVRTATAQVCAAAGLQGKWQATLPGGPRTCARSRGWSRPTSPAPGPPRRWAGAILRPLGNRTGDTVRVTVRLTGSWACRCAWRRSRRG